MNKKTKTLQGLCLLISGLSLSSCIYNPFFQRDSVEAPQSFDVPNESPSAKRSIINKADATTGAHSMPSIGNVNILVVPVEIRDAAKNNPAIADQCGFSDNESWNLSLNSGRRSFKVDWLDSIQKAFFGETDDTGYESVSSFYRKSSYGDLNISGVVAPVYTTSQTYSEMVSVANDKTQGAGVVTANLVEEIYQYYFVDTGIYTVDQFDGDKDGVIDGIWMVYDIPDGNTSGSVNQDLFWAYTSWYFGDKTASQEHISNYCWASKWFLTNGMSSQEAYVSPDGWLLPDSHTYIHETGHLMGLNDYYDTTYIGRSPAASLIMMDHNVYDHDPYSKYLLGWIDPERVKASDLSGAGDEKKYTLRPFSESGDALIIDLPDNSGWVGEEYLIMCYWTPTGLNQTDAENPYMDEEAGLSGSNPYFGLTEPGIMMFHVDSHFLEYRPYGDSWEAAGFVSSANDIWDAEDDSFSLAYMMGYSNDTGDDKTVSDVQLMMVDAGNQYKNMRIGYGSALDGGRVMQESADNSFLFHSGDRYDSSYLGWKKGSYDYGVDILFHGTSGADPSLTTGLKVDFGNQDASGALVTISLE